MLKRPIVVVGSINLDLVCTSPKIPLPGETVWGDAFQTFHGGKGANQAVAAGRLGAAVHMVGKVGDDAFGAELQQGLQECKVQTDHVTVQPAASSGVALITVDRNAQNSITVIAGANGKLLPRDLEECRPLLESAGMILTQLEIPLETVVHLSEIAEAAGVPFMLDPAPAPAASLPPDLLRRTTYLTPNETETCALCGFDPSTTMDESLASKAADRLLGSGVGCVILKMGDKGVYLAEKSGNRRLLPAFRVRAVDTTAAGDAFNGGLASGLTGGLALEQAIEFASAVAAVAVTRAGAQPAMPTMAEVQALLAANGRESLLQQLVRNPLTSDSDR